MTSKTELIAALAADYLNVYLVEPDLDRLTIVKANGVLSSFEESPEAHPYSSRVEAYAKNRVCKEDREAFKSIFSIASLKERLSKQSKLEFSYRALIDGEKRHYTGLYIRLSKPGEPLRLLAGFRNVDDIVYSEARKLDEGALKAYKALSAIYVATYRIDLKTDLYTPIDSVETIKKATPSPYFSSNIPNVVSSLLIEECGPEASSFLDTKTLAKRMEGKAHLSMQFESRIASTCRLHFMKEDEDEEGKPFHVLFAVELTDEGKYQSVFDVLSSEYQNVFYFNIYTCQGKVLKCSERIARAIEGRPFDYDLFLNEFVSRFVPEEERAELKKKLSLPSLQEIMKKQDVLSGNYTAFFDGKRHAYTYDYRKMKEKGYLVCGFRCVDAILEEHTRQEKLRREKEEAYQNEIKESYAKLKEIQDILAVNRMGTWRITLIEGKKPTMDGDELMRELLGVKGQRLSPEELYEAWYSNITRPALPSVLSSVAKMESEGFDENTYLWKHPKLGERYVRCGGTAYQVKGGYVLRGYHYDVDHTVRSEKEKEERLAEALASEKEHGEVIGAVAKIYSTIFLARLDSSRYKVISSPRLMEKLGKRKGDYQKAEEAILSNFIADDFKEQMKDFLDLSTLKDRLAERNTIAEEFRHPSGTWLEARFIAKSRDGTGALKEALYTSRDISKEKEEALKQESALRDALLLANHASRAKTTFLNSMSHDIRTPMNAIIGFTALAETHIDSKELVKDYLGKIHTSSTHLLSLINEILDMSRIESGTVKLEENSVHLPDVLHDLRTMIQGQVNAKSQNLYIDTLDVKHEDVVTDKLRLNQVLLNIVSNAIKYTGNGGNIFIRVSELPCPSLGKATYRFSVKDNGIGMSKEFVSNVFEAFSRERSTTVSGIQGTGLGMSIAKSIVDLMNGTIEVESEQGKGSEFIVTVDFPLSDAKVSYEPIPSLKGARALVVDDDICTCQSVCKMLREISMRPDWSTSGKESIIRAKEASDLKDEYKVYIIDYLMPDMNGIEAVRQIRKVIGEEIPIIILTAYDWSEVEEEAKQAGVTAFVAKPIFMSELRAILSKPREKKEEEKEPIDLSFKGKRALLAEDNALNREIATALLQELGLKVDSVSDGIEAVSAIDKAKEGYYDIVLMDIQMPKMDGYTATKEIRTLPSNGKANIPIVAMTANAFDEDRQKAFESGMNGHIAKPIDIKSITAALASIFGE